MAHKFGPREARASLFVRGVPFHIRRSQLEQVFAHHGEIRDVYIPLDYYTREPRGFAYVEFEDERDARYALKELDGARLWGQTIHLEWAKSDRKTPKEMRTQMKSQSDRRRGYDRMGRGGYDDRAYRMGGPSSYGHGGGGRGGDYGQSSYGHGGPGRGRYGSYSRSPSRERERGRPVRRRSRRSRSPSSSSYSSSYSNDKKMSKSAVNAATNPALATTNIARMGGGADKSNNRRSRRRNRSYSRSSYDSSRSRSRSRSYSSGSISSRSRSSSIDSMNGKNNPNAQNSNNNNNPTTTVTDISSSANGVTNAIQPDLPTAMDANGGQQVNNGNTESGQVTEKKRKHKKRKHKHRRHHRDRHHSSERRRHKKHRSKKRRKEKLNNEVVNAADVVVPNVDVNAVQVGLETAANVVQ